MRKENMTYYFSVEGETEKWYLDWLQNCINECDEAKYKVKNRPGNLYTFPFGQISAFMVR